MEIFKGDTVKISKFSYYYGKDEDLNPADKSGTVIKVDKVNEGLDGYIYWVRWSGEHKNTYRESDLLVLKRGKRT